jgi:hypothetical protein
MVLFQNGVRQLRSPAKMAATVHMPNLHNQYKSAERKISTKKTRTYAKLLLAM